jgi:serine/threonine-protein kinase HipA
MGALEFTPTENADDNDFLNQDLEITRLHSEAKKILEGKADEVTAKIMRIGGSAGGARAKALIDFNPKKGLIRSGFSKAKSGFIPAIIKFDGVKDGEEENYYGRLEYIYSLMAKKCGINMPQTYLLEENGRAHFIVERFDRNEKKEKIAHFASLCGLTGFDFYQKHSCSYEDLFQYVSYLTHDASQVIEAFKIMVFNIIFKNQDDHTKNFGFLMDQKGKWSFAPAYDLNYAYDAVHADTHQMRMNFKDDEFERHDFILTGKKFGLKERQVNEILDRTLACAEEFLKICEENSLDIDFAEGIHRNFRTYLK